MRPHSRRTFLLTAGTGVATGLAGCALGGQSPEAQAESHRETLSKYTDVARALEDGYQMLTPYVRTDSGVLGLVFYNASVPELEPEEPSVLFYNLLADGTYELLGVEWQVPTESTDSAPSMFGTELHGPRDGETAFIPEHYGLRAWLFDENPDGLFADYHSEVDSPPFIDDLETAWEALTPYYANGEKAETEGGYTNTEKCIGGSSGAYGVPYANTDRVGTTLREPPVLLYRLTSTWNYQIMGAEWYVPADSTDSPPTMFGQEFHGPMESHSSEVDQGSHYGLHVWLFGANPDGMFARYNPHVEC